MIQQIPKKMEETTKLELIQASVSADDHDLASP